MIFLWSFSKLKIKARTCQTNNIQWRLHDKSNIYLAFCMGNRASANWILNKKAIYTKSGQKMRKVSSWIITDGRHLFCIQIVLLRLVFSVFLRFDSGLIISKSMVLLFLQHTKRKILDSDEPCIHRHDELKEVFRVFCVLSVTNFGFLVAP